MVAAAFMDARKSEALDMTLIDVAKKTFAAIRQVAFLGADLVLLLGFAFFNNLRTSPIGHAGLVLMLLGDAVSFGIFWWKPRAGGLLLMGVSVASPNACVAGSYERRYRIIIAATDLIRVKIFPAGLSS